MERRIGFLSRITFRGSGAVGKNPFERPGIWAILPGWPPILILPEVWNVI